MDNKNQDSRYLTLWLCVIITAAIIFAGWIFFTKRSIDRTNAELGKGAGTMEQITEEIGKMFSDTDSAIKKNSAAVVLPVAQPVVEIKSPTAEKQVDTK